MYYGCDMGYKLAENDLRCHAANKVAIINLREQIKKVEVEAVSIKSATSDATPVQGGGSTREDRLLSNFYLHDKLSRELECTEFDVGRVERALALLNDEEYNILDRFYINRHKDYMERLMHDLNVAQPTVYKLKDAAFRHFLQAIHPTRL